jgi:Probable cobalt transporter subunit (CbtA)
MDRAKGEAPGPELVSRAVQSGVGLLTGVVVYGTAFGGLFALAFAFAYQRIGRLNARGTAALVLVPQLKYPSTPLSWPTGDYRVSKRIVFPNDPELGCCFGLGNRDRSSSCRSVRELERGTSRRGRVYFHHCGRPRSFTGYQRSPGPIPGRCPMAFQDRFVWCSADLVGNFRFVIRCPGRASS